MSVHVSHLKFGGYAGLLLMLLPLFVTPPFAQNVVITEINYNSPIYFNPEDWVEFYNPSANDIDLSGWVFKDEVDSQAFVFPENTLIEADGFVILCTDTSLFKLYFPGVENYLGNFHWGLSGGGELIRIYNDQGYIIDYLTYDDEPPWPTLPDGFGPTLELTDPSLDNTVAENWRASSYPFGSPGIKGWLGVENNRNEGGFPTEITLLQNYPNPFNPVTTISFYLPRPAQVSLKVFDQQGKEIARLINGIMTPGLHETVFNAEGLPSSVYFARLEADGIIKIQRLLLVK
jgi:hypothetical protein